MGAEIDELELKIKADAGKASSSIDKLAESMENLAKSLFVDTQKLSSIATGMRSISDAATGFKGGKSSEITSLNIALKKFNDVDTSSICGISSAMKNLSAGMSSMQGVNADGVTNVANALSKLGGIKATTGTDNLVKIKDDLARFVSGMNSVGTLNFDATGLTNLISGLSRMGGKASTQATKNLPTISAQLQNFVRQMNQIGSLKFEMSGLGELVTAISRLGSVASGRAVTNIPLLAKNLKELMETLSKAPAVSQNLIQMTNALANLAKTGSSSGRAANTLSKSLTGFSASAGSAKSSSLSLASAFGKLYASYWLIFRAFSKLKDAIDISSALTEVQNVVDTTFGNMAYKVDEFADNSIQQFGMSELAVKQYASRFQAMGTAMGINKSLISNANAALNKQTDGYIGLSDSLSDVSLNITKLTADMASFYDMEQSDVARNLQSIFTGETEPLRKYGLDLTQATLEEWAMKQGIDADMQSMSQAEKTMLRYQYVMANTTAAQGDFAKTADSWANQVRILKQSFEQLSSIVGGALINAFKPFLSALNVVMQKVIAFAETVTNALGAIFGWKFEVRSGGVTDDWSDVAGSASDIEDSTGKAAKNIDKMNKGIRKFDELNLITTDSSSGKGSGGKGGASGGGAGSGGLVKTDTIFKDYTSQIKDLYQLGEYIGDALTKAMNSINWDKIYKGAENFGKGLADFLNGLISPELFGAVGRTIAGALNTAIYAALSFGYEFDWSDLGLSIATGINEFFKTFDFTALASTINVWAKGILDTIITALENTDWITIGKKIGTFLARIDFTGIGKKVGKALWEAIKGGIELFAASFSKAPIETVLVTLAALPKLLNAIISSRFVQGIASLVSGYKKFATSAITVGSALAGNKDAVNTLKDQYPKLNNAVKVTGQAFKNFRFGIENGNFFTGMNEGIKTVRANLTNMQKGIIGVVSVIGEFALVQDAFKDLATGSGNLVSSIAEIAVGAGVAAAALYTAFGPAGLVVAAITGVVAAFSGIKKAMDEILEENVGEGIRDSLTNPGGVAISEIASNFSESMNEIGSGFSLISEKSQELQNTDANIRDTWLEIDKIKTSMDAGVISVEEGTEKLTGLFDTLATAAEQKFGAMETTLLTAFGENGALHDTMEQLGVDTKNTMQSVFQVNAETLEKINQDTQELKNLDPTNPRYAELVQEIQSLVGVTDEISTALGDYELKINSMDIDYSGLLAPDDTLSVTKVTSFLDTLTTSVKNAQGDIEKGCSDINSTLQTELNAAISTYGPDSEEANYFRTALGVIPSAMNQTNQDVAAQSKKITDTIQMDFVGRIGDVVRKAQTDWENLEWHKKLIYDFDETKYIQDSISNYKKNYIDPLSDEIETSMSEIGIDGAGWSKDAANKLTGSLFDTFTEDSYEGVQLTSTTLKSDWESQLKTSLNEMGQNIDAEGYGKQLVDDYNTQISNNASSSVNTVGEWGKGVDGKIGDGSLPGTAGKCARDVISSFNADVAHNASSSVTQMTSYRTSIGKSFAGVKKDFEGIGANIVAGLNEGMNSKFGEVATTATNIAKNVSQSVRSTLGIHSPSRVMKELGVYTMQGFQNGLELLYQPITSSLEQFGTNLTEAPSVDISSMYGGYSPNQLETGGNTYSALDNNTYNRDNAETNALLRQQNQLLQALLEKPNLGENDIFNATRTVYRQEAKRRYGNSSAFDPVLG
nr:MAG TPA: minor tail protein [Bacteriophage sp.]